MYSGDPWKSGLSRDEYAAIGDEYLKRKLARFYLDMDRPESRPFTESIYTERLSSKYTDRAHGPQGMGRGDRYDMLSSVNAQRGIPSQPDSEVPEDTGPDWFQAEFWNAYNAELKSTIDRRTQPPPPPEYAVRPWPDPWVPQSDARKRTARLKAEGRRRAELNPVAYPDAPLPPPTAAFHKLFDAGSSPRVDVPPPTGSKGLYALL
eukprot:TRINITY_DN39771_c0_g1_i1.p1 TRINITY_DN39771_c0_g1~~TRINITY_DN39771_c0_g1_i1.p1  ORF type:complete len:216 (+),score=36.15 TRINITY_DN39771_c0_g1_i1:33-650(+)